MKEITCINLDTAIEEHKTLGYRLDMIFPADNPREAVMSMGGKSVRLVVSSEFRVPSSEANLLPNSEPGTLNPEPTSDSEWITGRAGMEYRTLNHRFNGPPKGGTPSPAAIHHIRLTKGGEVLDYVHYHKIDFQMIYCLKGRIKAVYEDQGPPFWLEPGDCVLQPPEIRHRVLECEANSEVIEITMPAEHETWVEHDITLPTDGLKPDRDFGGQRFVCLQTVNNGEKPANIGETLDFFAEMFSYDECIYSLIHQIKPAILSEFG